MKQEDLQKAFEALGKGGIVVNGDLVMEKNVEHEVANVESGGIGILIVNKEEKNVPQMTNAERDIRSAIEELMEEKESEGEDLLFRNKKQWWAVYRVLSCFCNYPSKMTAFEAKMKEFEVACIKGKPDLSYESIKAAPKDVPLMATCLPSMWDSLKDKGENYRQQFVVADFLMRKLGIRS